MNLSSRLSLLLLANAGTSVLCASSTSQGSEKPLNSDHEINRRLELIESVADVSFTIVKIVFQTKLHQLTTTFLPTTKS